MDLLLDSVVLPYFCILFCVLQKLTAYMAPNSYLPLILAVIVWFARVMYPKWIASRTQQTQIEPNCHIHDHMNSTHLSPMEPDAEINDNCFWVEVAVLGIFIATAFARWIRNIRTQALPHDPPALHAAHDPAADPDHLRFRDLRRPNTGVRPRIPDDSSAVQPDPIDVDEDVDDDNDDHGGHLEYYNIVHGSSRPSSIYPDLYDVLGQWSKRPPKSRVAMV